MKMVFKKLTYSIKGSPTNEKMKKKSQLLWFGYIQRRETNAHVWKRKSKLREQKKKGRGSKVDSKILKLNLCFVVYKIS